MDDLAAALAGSFSVTSVPNNPAAPHPRFSQYKSRTSTVSQDERRRKYLELQKQKRFDFANYVRCLADDVWDDVEDEEDGESAEVNPDQQENPDGDEMDIDVRLMRPGRYYKNQLMLSEWMLEVPENLAEDWLMVPCPVGRRNLVVASNGRTRAYSRSGFTVNNFHSALPGGNRRHAHARADRTILDCVYAETDRKYYVLDVMCWGQCPVYDSETEFRFFWSQSKFQETTDALKTSNLNPCCFEVLPNFSCSRESIQRVMNTDFNFELDGILFYHKKAHYTFGTTPLVVWLKAYMMPEILGITVPDRLLQLAPASYTNFGTHADQVRKRKEEDEAASLTGSDGSSSRGSRRGHGRKGGRGRGGEGWETCSETTMDSAEISYEDERTEESFEAGDEEPQDVAAEVS